MPPTRHPTFISAIPVSITFRRTKHSPKHPVLPIASANTPSTLSTKLAAATAAALAASLIATSSPDAARHPIPPAVTPPANAAGASFLSASGDVIKDPESLLRWSLPVSNRPVRELQTEFEGAINDTRGLKWPKIDQHVKRGVMVLNNQSAKILTDIPEAREEEAGKILSSIADDVSSVETAVTEKSVEKLIKSCKRVLRKIGDVEQLMVTDFPFEVPREYASLPQLKGRATVEMSIKKASGEPFDIDGTLYNEGKMTIILDGYSAPLSAGAFVDLANKGFYDDNPILRSDGFIVQAGKPKEGEGYKDEKSGLVRSIPLEVFAKGDREPTYGITLEDDGRGAVGTVLPFTAYGTVAMARAEFEPNTASSQFFWFLFEPDLTPAGRNLMDGAWAVMGYTTKGERFLRGLQKGDRIVSAKVVEGIENLVL